MSANKDQLLPQCPKCKGWIWQVLLLRFFQHLSCIGGIPHVDFILPTLTCALC